MVVRRIETWHAEDVDVDAKISALATYLGHVEVRDVYWYYSLGRPRADERRRPRVRVVRWTACHRCTVRPPQVGFAQLVQDFFVRRLIDQRGASARTVESYRDAFELLFGYIEQRFNKQPARADPG